MSAPETEFALRRIVVALDGSRHAAAAAEAAARLAARFHAALEGLFVEDEDLVNLAGLPIGRMVAFPTGVGSAFDAIALERSLRAERDLARRALESVAGRLGLSASFRVLRGRVAAELIAAAAGADLVIVGLAGRSTAPRPRPGTIAVALAERAAASVLVHRAGAGFGEHALVGYEASPTAERALAAAVAMTSRGGARLRVVVLAPDADAAATLRERAGAVLAGRGVAAEITECVPASAARLCAIAGAAGGDALIIGAGSPLLAGAGRRELLAGLACPVLVVR